MARKKLTRARTFRRMITRGTILVNVDDDEETLSFDKKRNGR